MKGLEEGEASAVYRVRASVEVHDWLSRMTAEQRGELLARVMADQQPPAAEPLAVTAPTDPPTVSPLLVERAAQQPTPRPAAPAAPEEEEEATRRLRVLVSGRLPSGLSQPAIDLIHQLHAGDVLSLEGGRYWLTSRHTGERVRPSVRMVAALLARGLVG